MSTNLSLFLLSKMNFAVVAISEKQMGITRLCYQNNMFFREFPALANCTNLRQVHEHDSVGHFQQCGIKHGI